MSQQNSTMIMLAEHDGQTLSAEESSEAAFAYLRKNGSNISAVWLYNTASTPIALNQCKERRQPCSNPYADDGENARRSPSLGKLTAAYDPDAAGFVIFDAYGVLAFINENTQPGGCILAREDSPLAYALGDDFDDYAL